jgi:putative transposase
LQFGNGTEVTALKTEFRGSSWRMSDAFWRHLMLLLPKYRISRLGGRPRADVRKVMDGIFYVLRTGCQWKALPREYGSGSTVHRYFQEWTERGVFGKAWRRMLEHYDRRRGIGWNWQSVDGSMTKAPLGGEKNRQKPHRSRQARR